MPAFMGLASVSREALNADTDSDRFSPIDEDLEAKFRERFELVYDTPIGLTTHVSDHLASEDINVRPGNAAGSDETEYHEFRLFSGPKDGEAKNTDSATQRIVVRSPIPFKGNAEFVVPRRPDSYYFTGPLNGARAEQIAATAVSGEEVLKGLDLKWRGCYLPWRVTVIKSGPSKISSTSNHASYPTVNSSKKRVGKKRRIAIRKKKQAIEERKIAARRGQVEKEASEKEKRTRRNREKKVKKKLKEKMEKARRVEVVQDTD